VSTSVSDWRAAGGAFGSGSRLTLDLRFRHASHAAVLTCRLGGMGVAHVDGPTSESAERICRSWRLPVPNVAGFCAMISTRSKWGREWFEFLMRYGKYQTMAIPQHMRLSSKVVAVAG
jgi:hypothetical protein